MEYLDTTMRIFGYITGTGAGIAVLYKLYMWFRKPSKDNSAKIEQNSDDIEKLKERAEENYNSIEEIKNMQSLIFKSIMELLDAGITGDNIQGLTESKKAMVDYLTDSK